MESSKRTHLIKNITMNFISCNLLIISLLACGTKNKSTSEKAPVKAETVSGKTPAQLAVGKVTVSGSITQTSSYCGGAAPPDELIQQLAAPKPFPKQKLHVIKGDTNTEGRKIILDFISDSLGNFIFQLEPGNYSIILDEQVNSPDAKKYKTQTQNIDEDCYKKWWAAPYYLLEVPASTKPTSIKGLNFNFHKRCFISSDIPCLSYNGPYPP